MSGEVRPGGLAETRLGRGPPDAVVQIDGLVSPWRIAFETHRSASCGEFL
jgi:hypothetical protein